VPRSGQSAEACNTGFEPLVRPDVPALRRSRLSWVRQNYLRAETLTLANVRLVAAQNGIDLARRWGGGDVASADGLRFIVPVRTIHAGPNQKYFGPERGVTYYKPSAARPTAQRRGATHRRAPAPSMASGVEACATALRRQ
jgi:Tn3 transposase DDE domain-containing protein